MSRPSKCRRVAYMPEVTYFKPAGIPLRALEEVQPAVRPIDDDPFGEREGPDEENPFANPRPADTNPKDASDPFADPKPANSKDADDPFN